MDVDKCPLPVDRECSTPWDLDDWKHTMLHVCKTIVTSLYSEDNQHLHSCDVHMVKFVLTALLVEKAGLEAAHASMHVTQSIKVSV